VGVFEAIHLSLNIQHRMDFFASITMRTKAAGESGISPVIPSVMGFDRPALSLRGAQRRSNPSFFLGFPKEDGLLHFVRNDGRR
jgi:hypothetical protein